MAVEVTEQLEEQVPVDVTRTPTPMWELECTCPDFCERDHELD